MVIDQTIDQEGLNHLLLQNTSQTILFNAQNEFSKLIEQLDGNEDLLSVSKYFFEEGYRRLSSENNDVMDDLIEVLSKAFLRLVSNFEDYIEVDVENDYNITEKIGRFIRFINLIQAITSKKEDMEIKFLIKNIGEIKEFILNNYANKQPHEQNWAPQFKRLERNSFNKRKGYEPYYATGVVEIIRTISNKKRHPHAFPKQFNTNFNFYNDFHQIIGVYNLALYSFIELIEAWVSVKPFIDHHLK